MQMQKENKLTGDVNEEGSNDPCSQLLFRNPPPREWYKYPALEINPTNIQIWIHEQDVESLETVVYEGHGDLLLETSADNFKTLKFLEKVPKLMNDILEVHESAVTGDLNALVNKEYRTKIYSAKDKNGITAFHKAVALKQKNICEFFIQKTEKSVISIKDVFGRTPLHYAAAYGRRRDDKTMYYWLIDMGANSTEPDKYNITPQQALRKEVSPEIELHLCSELPDAPKLLPPTPSPKQSTVHLNNINLSSVKALECREFKKPESILALFGSSTKLIPLSKMTKENISKWVRVGNIGTLEQVVYAGRGQYLINKPAWNEETRKYLKTIPNKMKQIQEFHDSIDTDKIDSYVEIDAKFLMSRDTKGRTILHKSSQSGEVALVKKLLNKMSEIVKLLDRRFRNALHYAARHADESKRNEIIAYLESYGLDRSTTDTFGNNADFYMQNDFPEIAPKEEGVEVKSSDESEDEPTLEPTNEIKITIEEYFDPLNVVKQAIKKQAKLTLKPQLTHLKGDEEEESQVRNAIKEKNFDILVKHILEGNSDKLMNKTSTDEEVQEFLDSVSIYQTKISKLHKAVENGSLKQLQIHLDRRKLVVSKEKKSGISILHKAVLLKHNEIVKYLTSYFPETLNVKDKLDRTPLHYAAAISDRDALSSDTSIYGMLINAGADNQIKDKKNNVPDIYVIKKSEFNETILKKYMRDPEPFLPTIEQPQHVTLEGSYNETEEDELTKWRYMKNITSEEDKQYYEGIFEEEGSDEEGITDFNVPEGNLDLETIAQLERSFRKITWARQAHSLLKKFLIKPVFDKLKEKITISHGASLFDVIKGGIEILNHDLGVVAPDPESYKVFAPIIKPIIYTYHNIPILKNQLRSRTQPETQWKPSDKNFWKNVNDIKVQSCDSSILSYKISLHRSIKGYPLNSRMTSNQYITLENDMKAVLSNCSFFPLGHLHQLKSVLKSTEQNEELTKYFLPIVENNKDEHIQFFIAAGGSNFWPLGRSTWVAPREGYNSIQIRINQIDHLEVIRCFSPSEELLDVILETRDILDEIELKLRDLEESMIYLRDTEYGYLTFSPGDLGTGLRLFGYMEVPNNVNFKILKATEVTDNFSLRINGKVPSFSSLATRDLININNKVEVSNRITFGLMEADIVFQFFEGLKNLISLKQSLEVDHVRFALKT